MFQLFDEETAKRVWVCSDLHFGHKNMMNFSSVRNDFADGDIMNHDARLVARINEVVGENGILLCLGDVSLRKEKMVKWCSQLITKDKYLIRGNHDNCSESTYKELGWKILPMLEYGKVLFSHYPVHPLELGGFEPGKGWGRYVGNCHGHIHQNSIDDKRYYNVSLEAINMTPVKMLDVVHQLNVVNQQFMQCILN